LATIDLINPVEAVLAVAAVAVELAYRREVVLDIGHHELKNQWGWGGFNTHDMHRSQITARAVALVYNWWREQPTRLPILRGESPLTVNCPDLGGKHIRCTERQRTVICADV
jgi:hypothetical protein